MTLNILKYYFARLINRRPASIKNSLIDKKASIGNGAQIVDCEIGKYSYVYESKVISTTIGNFCSIAADCTIGGGSHPTNWVSTSPAFYAGKNSIHVNFSENHFDEYVRTNIGHDVWIGSKCLIKGGVSIGNGAIIGMGSVVTHDLPPYEIWAGNPARKIRDRFTPDIAEKLIASEWWNWSDAKLREKAYLFNNVSLFLSDVANKHNENE